MDLVNMHIFIFGISGTEYCNRGITNCWSCTTASHDEHGWVLYREGKLVYFRGRSEAKTGNFVI